MLKPIKEVWDMYGTAIDTDRTRAGIQNYLNSNYPEVHWTVNFDSGVIKVHAGFRSPEEETFYKLKWS